MIFISVFIGYRLFNNNNWGKTNINHLITNLLFLPLLRRNYINKLLISGFKITKNIETSWSESLGAQGLFNLSTKVMISTRLTFILIYITSIVF